MHICFYTIWQTFIYLENASNRWSGRAEDLLPVPSCEAEWTKKSRKLVGGEATRHTASCWQFPVPFTDGNHVGLTYDPFKKHFANGNYKKQLTRSRTKHCNKNVTGAKTIWISLNCHLMLKTHISRLMRVVPNAALGSSQNTTFLLHLFMKLRLLIIY